MEAVVMSETLVHMYQTTWHYYPQNNNSHSTPTELELPTSLITQF